MKTPESLPENIVALLLPRLSDEFTAYYTYRAASNWCKNVGFMVAAEYFAKESADELSHAKRIEDFFDPAYWQEWHERLADHAIPEMRRADGDYELPCRDLAPPQLDEVPGPRGEPGGQGTHGPAAEGSSGGPGEEGLGLEGCRLGGALGAAHRCVSRHRHLVADGGPGAT